MSEKCFSVADMESWSLSEDQIFLGKSLKLGQRSFPQKFFVVDFKEIVINLLSSSARAALSLDGFKFLRLLFLLLLSPLFHDNIKLLLPSSELILYLKMRADRISNPGMIGNFFNF